MSPKVLWGDVTSALNGAAAVLDRFGGLPQLVAVRRGRRRLYRLPALERDRPVGPPRFVRNTCCLYYRIPGAGLCGDCVLDR